MRGLQSILLRFQKAAGLGAVGTAVILKVLDATMGK